MVLTGFNRLRIEFSSWLVDMLNFYGTIKVDNFLTR
jgi:hypothetical protein